MLKGVPDAISASAYGPPPQIASGIPVNYLPTRLRRSPLLEPPRVRLLLSLFV
jgi:hypothetical protein